MEQAAKQLTEQLAKNPELFKTDVRPSRSDDVFADPFAAPPSRAALPPSPPPSFSVVLVVIRRDTRVVDCHGKRVPMRSDGTANGRATSASPPRFCCDKEPYRFHAAHAEREVRGAGGTRDSILRS